MIFPASHGKCAPFTATFLTARMQKLSRKLVHISTGLLFMLTWVLYRWGLEGSAESSGNLGIEWQQF